MYQKLQRRFLWVSTLVLVLVIGAVVGAVYWIASGMLVSQATVLMELILMLESKLSPSLLTNTWI